MHKGTIFCQLRRPFNLTKAEKSRFLEFPEKSLCGLCAFLWPLCVAGGSRGGFDQALNNLGHLRERFRLSEKCIGAASSRFIFDFGGTVSRQNYDSSLRVVFPDETDHVETIMIVGHREAQILDYDFVVCGAEKFFSFFDFAGGVDSITLQRKVLAHRETNGLFIVDDQQTRYWQLCGFIVLTQPHLSQFT